MLVGPEAFAAFKNQTRISDADLHSLQPEHFSSASGQEQKKCGFHNLCEEFTQHKKHIRVRRASICMFPSGASLASLSLSGLFFPPQQQQQHSVIEGFSVEGI